MFFILAVSALMLLPMMFKKKITHRYEKVSVCAVKEDNTEVEVTTPSQLPEDINYFIITYTIDDIMYKICRNSVTVPQSVKKIDNYWCTKAIAIDELGNTNDVTDILEIYSGPLANFHGNDISVIEILKHHNVHDVYAVITVAKDLSWKGILHEPCIQLHTAINITDIYYQPLH